MTIRVRTASALAGALLLMAPAIEASAADANAPAAAAKYTIADTPLGTLIDDPVSRAVIETHAPDVLTHPQLDMARGMTLRQLQVFAGDILTEEVLEKIDADLAKLSA